VKEFGGTRKKTHTYIGTTSIEGTSKKRKASKGVQAFGRAWKCF